MTMQKRFSASLVLAACLSVAGIAAITISIPKASAQVEGKNMDAKTAEDISLDSKGYIIIEHEALSQERLASLKTYSAVTTELMEKYGATFLIMEGKHLEPLEGNWDPKFMVVIEFPSMASARKFYYSEKYQSVLSDRLNAFPKSRAVLAGGRALPADKR